MNRDLEKAILDGDHDQVQTLLDAGADVNSLNRFSQTPLMLAAHRGHTVVVQLLIDRGADLNHTAKYGLSALMLAIVSEHDEVAMMLIDAGADLSIPGSGAPGFHNKTAYDLAKDGGRTAVAERIRAKLDRGM